MKGAIVAALVGSAAAAVHQGHQGFHLRREAPKDDGVCYVYTTVYVTATPSPTPVRSYSAIPIASVSSYVTPSSKPAPPPASSSSASVYVPVPAPVNSKQEAPPAYTPVSSPPPPPPASSSSKPAPPPPSSTPKPAPPPASSSKSEEAPKPKPTGGSGYGANIVANGQKWAITYTPYAKDGQCMSAGQVQTDVARIAKLGYTTLRVYNVDCGVFENVVPAAAKNGMKIIYGIFLDAANAPGSAGANKQLDSIIKNAPKDSFAMLIVGNEYMSGHGGSVETLAPYVKECKKKLVGAGFPETIPVTTTETVGALEQYGKSLCDVIDVLAAQVHPYFDGKIAASGAGEFAVKQLEQAAKVCPEAAARGKYITEIGWPTGGKTNGIAIPSPESQKEAISSIIKSVGSYATLFSYQDDDWKNPGAYGVEQKFGCADVL
ncbi:glycoside hydrolase family 17 protein [Periconia macrospinosa]|uniref:Probable beta-glucosidase btgE n=1 Tax=Periconia macrospinosa TaxID=97972 RepID=A0A2V1EEX0_9PLEO|nr:glycoside hydrolase family 17 protein [Periconia macrospinosa]